MIEANAARVKKKAKQTVLPKRLPLDFAQLVAHHRADRVSAWKQIEANSHHQYDIQNAVELENQFNERHRMEDRLRIGGLPASITHPVAAAMVAAQNPAAAAAAAASSTAANTTHADDGRGRSSPPPTYREEMFNHGSGWMVRCRGLRVSHNNCN